MSNQKPQVPQLMDPDAAYNLVHNRIYAPVFFEKLANDFGIRPQNDAEALSMLSMAAQLRQANDAHEKQAQARATSPLAAAQQHLNKQLTKMGFAIPTQQAQQNDNLVKQAAAQVSFDPAIASAIISMQALSNGVTQEQLAVLAQQPAA